MVSTQENTPNWYAIRVRQRIQFEVDRLLESRGVESYAPSVIEVHRWSDRAQKVRVPLFQGYSFVRIPWTPPEVLTVLRTPGVMGFVPENGPRAPIESHEIEAVKRAANSAGCTSCDQIVAGRRVRVTDGYLRGLEGTFVRKDRGDCLVISVGQIQRSVSVPLQSCQVEPL